MRVLPVQLVLQNCLVGESVSNLVLHNSMNATAIPELLENSSFDEVD